MERNGKGFYYGKIRIAKARDELRIKTRAEVGLGLG